MRADGKSERAIFVVDKRGIIRYIDIHDIDQQPSNDVLCEVLAKIDPQAAARAPKPATPADVALPHGGIVMYCTTWCPDCRRARAWLQMRNLSYTEVDITLNRAASAQVRQWGNGKQITPTFEIDGTILVDFNEQKLQEALKAKGYL